MSRRLGLAMVAVTAALIALLLVLSMVRAQWREAPAGQTVVVPMPPLGIASGPGLSPGPAPAPKAPIKHASRAADTFATAALRTKPDPVLPDEFALLPPESIEALQRSTAEWESGPYPVAATPAPALLSAPMDGAPPRVGEDLTVPVQPSRSSPPAVDVPANLRSGARLSVAGEAPTVDGHSAVAAAPSATRRQSTIDGTPSRVEESSTVPVQPSRSWSQVVAEPANLRSAASIQVASQAVTADDNSALPAGEIRVFIHHVADQRDGALAERLADYLRSQGFTVADIRTVGFSIGKASVRYFFARDRAASERLVEELGRFSTGGASLAPDHASDFSHFVPKPRPGSVEVWLPAS